MRRTSVSIGILRVSVLLASALWAGSVSADVSPSYTLVNDFPNAATNNGGSSTNFTLSEGQLTWNQKPITGTNFQIVPAGGGVSSSSTSSSSQSSGGGSSTSTPTGSRGDRAGTGGRSSSSSSSFSFSSSRSILPGHGAALSDAGGEGSERDASSSSTQSQEGADGETFTPSLPTLDFSSNDDGAMSFFGATDTMFLHSASDMYVRETGFHFSLVLFWILLITLLLCIGLCAHVAAGRSKDSLTKALLKIVGYVAHLIAALLLMLSIVGIVYAAQTVPSTHIYNGRLLDSSGNPVTTSTSIRFSYWKSADYITSDTTGAGAINTGAAQYAGWTETHTVTPNASGYFSVKLGSVTALPDFASMATQTLISLYLQVEVKAAASADTAYEVLDPDTTDTAIDRSGVLSVPFAKNADLIDQRQVGTGSGDIAILGSGATFAVSTVPNGTNTSSFTLDADNTELSAIALTFGASLGKKLTYDIVNSTFKFNASLEVQGNLTVTGLINGVNVTQLQSSTGALKAFSGGGLNLSVSRGSYRLAGTITNYAGGTIALSANSTNYVFFGSGGLTKNVTGFPTDESFIPLASVLTSGGGITIVTDLRTLSSDDREHETAVTFNPSFEKASYQGDGADNIGQLSVSHDNISLKNFYTWTSTKTSLQDYDVLLRVPVSENFVRWQSGAMNPVTLQYRSTSASSANNKLDIQIYDTSGVPVTLSGSVSNLAGTSWTTTQIEFGGTPTWTAGQEMLLRLKMSAKDAYQMHLGSLRLQFVELE